MEGLLVFIILVICYAFGYRLGAADARKEIRERMEEWMEKEGEQVWQNPKS